MSQDISHLFVSDRKMIELMEYCVAHNVNGISTKSEWCDTIRFAPTNLHNVKNGLRGFSKEHLYAAGAMFGANMEYLFGFSTQMFRSQKKLSPLEKLKLAVNEVEQALQKSGTNKKLKPKLKQT